MTNRTKNLSKLIIVGLTLGFSIFIGDSATAQVGSVNPYGLSGTRTNPLQELRRRLTQTALSSAMLPMEGAVDPEEYVVGPGDIFLIYMPLTSGVAPEIAVGADGRLLLPDAGPVSVAGLFLAQARIIILARLKDSHQNTPVDIVLLQPRQFYVHVSGTVPSPGRKLALPVARVSTILELAYADTTWAPVSNSELRPSLRNIRLIHNDGTESSVDLPQYFASGDTDTNPYLRDGDVIHVPAYDPAFSSVYIDGAVLFPGPYDYRPGDTISSLIAVSGGLSVDAATEQVRVRRELKDGSVRIFEFDLEQVLKGNAGDFEIAIRDHVSVAHRRQILGSAMVEGMVNHPGTYPIEDGVTTLSDVIEKAGGLRDDALQRGAVLIRRSLPEPIETVRRSVFEKPLSSIQQILVADSTEIMQRLRMTDLDFLSRAYFAQEVRMQNRVSIDLEKTMNGSAVSVTIRDGDRLVIPRDEQTVYVVGQVKRPGFVGFQEGQNAEYFIESAGGRGEFASEAVIINPGTFAVERVNNQTIRSGDTIFIDRITDIAENPELQRLVSEQIRTRSDAKIRTMQTILQSVTTVATVVALIISLSR